jgi:hypothetical protein
MVDSTTGRVFISYRREETRHVAGRLSEWLRNRVGHGRVFMDVEDIEPGADFAAQIDREVSLSSVLLPVIGREWATMVDETGRRRLDDPDDFIVLEVQAALDRDIYVIPVLVDGAQLPRRETLPSAIRRVVDRQAIRLGHETFSADAGRLLALIRMRLDAASTTLNAQPGDVGQYDNQVIASGARAVAVGGDISGSTITTGDQTAGGSRTIGRQPPA